MKDINEQDNWYVGPTEEAQHCIDLKTWVNS